MTLFTLRDHERDEGAHAVNDAVQVDAERPFPLVGGGLPYRSAPVGRDTCVVAQHMYLAVPLEGTIPQRLDLVQTRHIRLDADYVQVLRLQLADRGIERISLDVGEHDLHALAGESLGQAAADAAGGAGDHGDFTRKISHRSQRPAAREVRVGSSPACTSSLPKFLPCSMPMNAAAALSSPSTMSSRYLSAPLRTHMASIANASS